MIKIVEHLHADKCHGVRFLRDRGGDDAFLNPVERLLISVHSDHRFSTDVIAVEDSRDFLSRLCFEANKTVDLVALLAHNLSGGVESDTWITLNVDDSADLDLRSLGERVFVAAQAILQVLL